LISTIERTMPHPAHVCLITERAPGMTGEVIQMDNGLHLNAG
jgi:3-oxoacyl-[acyl-carrier protein] reductase